MENEKETKFSKERLETCLSCSLVIKGFLSERCSVCGCFVRLKTKFNGERCPIGKWS
ncbi:DUF6171 family protein [Leptospira barantonii]|uniref:DUF6171 family protein n=1 Tax=Leptospira barantonii TaxID=2023184 RepID=UPI0031E808DB